MTSSPSVPAAASAAVLKPSDPVPESAVSVQGPNFDSPPSLDDLLESYKRIGFQANSLGKAIDIVNKMVSVQLPTHFFSCSTAGVFSVAGASPMRLSSRTRAMITWIPRSELKLDATFSSVTRPTSSPLGYERSSFILSSTSKFLQLLRLQEASRKISSSALVKLTLLTLTSTAPTCDAVA